MRTIRALAGLCALAASAAPPAQSCLTTLYADNNGGSAGGAVYFDASLGARRAGDTRSS